MNNKGMILSTYIYILLTFFLLLLGTVLIVLNNTKLLESKLALSASDVTGEFNIILKGNKEDSLIINSTYSDPGYIAKDINGNTLTATIVSNVDATKFGNYTITYTVSYKGASKSVVRKIRVYFDIVYLVNGVQGVENTDYVLEFESEEKWKVSFLNSGTFIPTTNMVIDAFLVGGGGGGANDTNDWATGGGGGRTETEKNIVLFKNVSYPIVIGEGGSTGNSGYPGNPGKNTTAFAVTAGGASGGIAGGAGQSGSGGSGGSNIQGVGGSDGSNGITGGGNGFTGKGQGTTTREFAESSGKLYAGGGAGARGKAGLGGGGLPDKPGEVNTGGGGGARAAGGSGIVVIRNSKEYTQIPNINYSYTGSARLITEGNGKWKIAFTTSGTFIPATNMVIDAFLVGGGGGGANDSASDTARGGGGGQTITEKNIVLFSNVSYAITIAYGGNKGIAGENTTAFSINAGGGSAATAGWTGKSGSGGSGGGAVNETAGSDGSSVSGGGSGQGTTTREFSEITGKLYSGGGAGAGYNAIPGLGGGGASKLEGAPNTGGGGGAAAAGGSGIVIIRNSREYTQIPNINYSYTGSARLITEGNDKWKIAFTTSGTFIPATNMVIDAFLVGGGGGGANDSENATARGGGGGYTITEKNKTLISNTEYPITIASGGNVGTIGGNTTAFSLTANGGTAATAGWGGISGSGGSGGGKVSGAAGSDGSSVSGGGNGQGTTTKEFGEINGKLYAGGGAGASGTSGLGGGGPCNTSGAPNTGGGGGARASGGSGIVVIRNAR